jgi:hypothetical protein
VAEQATIWPLFALALVLAAARIAMHIQNNTKILLQSDIWLVIAVLDCLSLIICDTLNYKAGAMSLSFEAPLYIRKVRSPLIAATSTFGADVRPSRLDSPQTTSPNSAC